MENALHYFLRRIRRVAIVLAGLGVSVLAMANGMRLVSQDGFATARGEAFVATADNAAAVYYNPAGLTQLDGQELRGGIYGLYYDPTYQPPAGSANAGHTYHLERKYAAAPQSFYGISAPELGVAAGLGIYAPYGADVTWPQDTGFRAVAISGTLTYLRVNPVLAFRIGENLSIGAGLMVDYGEIELNQGLLRTEQPFKNYFRFHGDDVDAGGNFGIRWQPLEQLAFGATCRTHTRMKFSGETEFVQQPIIRPTELPAEAEFQFPFTVAFGVSYRPTTNWNVEFDADYTDWSVLDSVLIRQMGATPFPVRQNIPVQLQWQASWIFSAGATRYLADGWRVSGGYVFNQTSVPDDFYSPLAADVDRHFVAVGLGHRGRRFDFDVAYQFGYGPAHTVAGSQPASQPGLFSGQRADGTYDFVSHALMVTVGWRF